MKTTGLFMTTLLMTATAISAAPPSAPPVPPGDIRPVPAEFAAPSHDVLLVPAQAAPSRAEAGLRSRRTIQMAQAPAAPGAPALPPPPPPPHDPAAAAGFAHGAAMAEMANSMAMAASTEDRLRSMFGPKTRKALIVSTGVHDSKAAAQLDEDLNVMMRILEKTTNAREEGKAMGIDLFSLTGASTPRMFYLEGYGALFVLKVRQPLVEPTRADEGESGASTSSDWEKARQEIYGRGDVRWAAAPAEEYDAERVDKLQAQLIQELANATHIRGLKGDEGVTITVMGGAPRTVVRQEVRTNRPGNAYASSEVRSTSSEGGQSTMTLRAKKADIDAFAKGKMKLDEFKKKVAVQKY